MTPDQLVMEAAEVTGSLMNLVSVAGSDSERDSSFTWNGAVDAQVKVPAKQNCHLCSTCISKKLLYSCHLQNINP